MKVNKLKTIQSECLKKTDIQEKAIAEIARVSSELKAIDVTIDNLDSEFEKKTGITNKKDMSFLFVAIALQSVRWILCPQLESPKIKDGPAVDKADRLGSEEKNHKGGPYDGKSAGKPYQNKEINRYLEGNKEKANSEREEYRRKLKGDSKYQYRTWLEILLRNVPYDAMYAKKDDAGNILGKIPAIIGLKDADVNLSPQNHHVATLGHDPVLGWVFGTINIITNTITFCNFMSFGVEQESVQLDKWNQYIDYSHPESIVTIIRDCLGSCQEDTKRIPAAVARQGMHFVSDKYCIEGLPIPFLSSINPEKAQKLIDEGWNSIEASRIVNTVCKDIGIIGISVLVDLLINFIIKSIYLLTCDEEDPDYKLMEVRIKKVLLISNIIASGSSVIYALVTEQYGKIDVAGIGVSIVEAFKTKSFIDQVKLEYLSNGIENAILGEEDWFNIVMEENK